jgi:hypothetical protein
MREHSGQLADSIITASWYEEGVNYKISDHEFKKIISPVDYQNTGVIQLSLIWSNGLHQYLELKHSLYIKTESLTNVFRSYVGYFLKYEGNIYGLTGTLGVSFNNFSLNNIFHKKAWDPLPMGDGQKRSLRVQSNGRAFRSYNFSFTEPWLGGKKRNSLTFSIYDTKYANAYNPATGTYTSSAANASYIRTTGVGVNLGRQLQWPDDYFSLSVGVNFARYKLKNYYIDQINSKSKP